MIDLIKRHWRSGLLPAIGSFTAVLFTIRALGWHKTSDAVAALSDFLLILLGVLTGLLFLPTPERQGAELQDVILRSPLIMKRLDDGALTELVRDVIAASKDRATADLATKFGWKPIIDAIGKGRLHVRDNVNYEIQVMGPSEHGLRIATILTCALRLPPVRQVWVSFATSAALLRLEFDSQQCLHRELAQVITDGTNTLVAASVRVDETPLRALEPEFLENDCLLRFPFELGDPATGLDADRLRQVTIRTEFNLHDEASFFPVVFSDYFCRGRTRVSFTSGQAWRESVEVMVNFTGDITSTPAAREAIQKSSNAGFASITVDSPRECLLWPGSGVVFVWYDRPSTPLGS